MHRRERSDTVRGIRPSDFCIFSRVTNTHDNTFPNIPAPVVNTCLRVYKSRRPKPRSACFQPQETTASNRFHHTTIKFIFIVIYSLLGRCGNGDETDWRGGGRGRTPERATVCFARGGRRNINKKERIILGGGNYCCSRL